MKKSYSTCFLITSLLAASGVAMAASTEFTAQDYSGVYDCTGQDAHEGPYEGVVTMKLNRAQSSGDNGSYSFKLEVPGYGTYLGEAATDGTHAAMHFALTNPATHDFGTGIAEFSINAQDKFTFHKFYYEPEFKGGNYGTEDCTQR